MLHVSVRSGLIHEGFRHSCQNGEAAVAAPLALHVGHWCGVRVIEAVMLPGPYVEDECASLSQASAIDPELQSYSRSLFDTINI